MNRPSGPACALAVVLAVTMGAALPGCGPGEEPERRLSVSGRLGGQDSGQYERATEPRVLRFPADHGPHPGYKHEWWYLTGQVATPGGRRFGFQFTVFREAVSPQPIESPSRWATNQIYLAHAAVTDVEGRRYFSDERYARGALGLAGAQVPPLRVWLENWRLAGDTDADGGLKGRITAGADDFGYELELRNTRPPVAHGDRGLSLKGAAGNASYYYSYTRLLIEGTVRAGDAAFDVEGEGWLDHEWSTSYLTAEQAGWDWFSLQLSGDGELMIFRLRHRDDPRLDFYRGTYVAPSGEVTALADQDIRIQALDHWTSEATGVRYPVRWRATVPALDLMLTTEPLLEDQEFAHSFRYWEGAVRVSGERGGKPVEGKGYVELAGYADGGER